MFCEFRYFTKIEVTRDAGIEADNQHASGPFLFQRLTNVFGCYYEVNFLARPK